MLACRAISTFAAVAVAEWVSFGKTCVSAIMNACMNSFSCWEIFLISFHTLRSFVPVRQKLEGSGTAFLASTGTIVQKVLQAGEVW